MASVCTKNGTLQIKEKLPRCDGFYSSFGRNHYFSYCFEEQFSKNLKANIQAQDNANVFGSLYYHMEKAEECRLDTSSAFARTKILRDR